MDDFEVFTSLEKQNSVDIFIELEQKSSQVSCLSASPLSLYFPDVPT